MKQKILFIVLKVKFYRQQKIKSAVPQILKEEAMEASLGVGNWVFYQKKSYQIKSILNLNSLETDDQFSDQLKIANITYLMHDIRKIKVEIFQKLILISQIGWEKAKCRQFFTYFLSQLSHCSKMLVQRAATKFGLNFHEHLPIRKFINYLR